MNAIRESILSWDLEIVYGLSNYILRSRCMICPISTTLQLKRGTFFVVQTEIRYHRPGSHNLVFRVICVWKPMAHSMLFLFDKNLATSYYRIINLKNVPTKMD